MGMTGIPVLTFTRTRIPTYRGNQGGFDGMTSRAQYADEDEQRGGAVGVEWSGVEVGEGECMCAMHDIESQAVVWCGVVRCGVMWCGMMWCDVA